MTETPGGAAAGGPVSDRMQALLSRAVEEQVSEQRAVSTVLGELRGQVAALAAEGKLSALVLGGLPPLFLIYLIFTRYDYVSVLFSRPLGWLLLGGGAFILSIGAFWMSRIVKVEV